MALVAIEEFHTFVTKPEDEHDSQFILTNGVYESFEHRNHSIIQSHYPYCVRSVTENIHSNMLYRDSVKSLINLLEEKQIYVT